MIWDWRRLKITPLYWERQRNPWKPDVKESILVAVGRVVEEAQDLGGMVLQFLQQLEPDFNIQLEVIAINAVFLLKIQHKTNTYAQALPSFKRQIFNISVVLCAFVVYMHETITEN